MHHLPTGTVTFLFTDIEGSTRLLHHLGDTASERVFAVHRRLLRSAVESAGGYVYQDQGESFLFVFQRAKHAVRAAIEGQRALESHSWPEGAPLRVRMGLHSGEPILAVDGYVGMDIHRAARICQAGHGGQILLSQTTRDLVDEDLGYATLRDLGEHRLKDLTRPQRLFHVTVADLRADFPPLRSLDALRHNLPIQLTSFIGREREKAEIKRLLSSTRLLTLTGAGGSGKTRLALQVAAELVEEYSDGVWLANLAPVTERELVAQTVANVLGVQKDSDVPISVGVIPTRRPRDKPLLGKLIDYLRQRRLLLILDNCEHLLSECALLSDALLGSCPDLRIFATSREALGLMGELTYRVPSLSLPEIERLPPLPNLREYEAVRLFAERSAFYQPHFALTGQNAPAIVRVCHMLDGMPLAIEMAAARVNALSVEQIASRLGDRFRLLTRGSRTTSPRQQTLQACMDWSYNLLSDSERVLLGRLSVFARGFTLDAVEAVCADSGLQREDVLDLLTQLVDKSLVVADVQEGAAWYRLLETVRDYSQQKLLESGEAPGLHRRHQQWYLALAERAALENFETQKTWFDRLESQHDNLRAAMSWSLQSGDPETCLRIATALYSFWFVRAYHDEGRRWLNAALSATSSGSALARAKGLTRAGWLAFAQGERTEAAGLADHSWALSAEHGDKAERAYSACLVGAVERDEARAEGILETGLALSREIGRKDRTALALAFLGDRAAERGDYERATTLQGEALALHREIGPDAMVAADLNNLGYLALRQGAYDHAAGLCAEALEIFRKIGHTHGITYALANLAFAAREQQDHAKARVWLEQALALAREAKATRRVAFLLNSLGELARSQGDDQQAALLYDESLTLYRTLGDDGSVAGSLHNLGYLALHQRNHRRALELFREAAAAYKEVGKRWGIALCLAGLGCAEAAGERWDRAARLLGSARAQLDAAHFRPDPLDGAEIDRGMQAAHGALGEAKFASALSQGTVMTLEQAIQYALTDS